MNDMIISCFVVYDVMEESIGLEVLSATTETL